MYGEFPSHWQVLSFTEAVKDSTSRNVKIPRSEYLSQGCIPIVDQGQSLFGGYADDRRLKTDVSLPAIVFGDHTRVFKFIEEEFCLGADGAKLLEPKVNLDKKFLYYYLSSLRIEAAGYSRHFKFLKKNVVPVPPIEEQKRIADILDKADVIHRKRQQAIALADEFLRSVFLDMFGDPVLNPKKLPLKSLESISTFVAGSALPNTEEYDGQDEGVAAFKVGDMNALGNEYYLVRPRKWAKTYKKANALVPEGTIVFPKRGGAIGTNKKRITKVSAVLDPNLMGVIPGESIPLEYLYFWFQLLDLKTISSGSSVPQLNKKDLAPLKVVIPPKPDLDRFVEISRTLRGSKAMQNSALEMAGDLFQSLSQKAFSGEL
ncbi:restriction endonuclease subunit S [Microbulbifer sp. YPW16]|uniref:restriction endonuclease subunit S n=1 Tax=Microbulbifer sp. YPW16 TaxID=2904242 RepID=UPI001E2AD1BF|nr:restriction endonuclease subunit S [Microbulbifer sp. YPW16]UHQ55323.1 restriction endonuclease subunit S [Microbulbifer sp. YPW16]